MINDHRQRALAAIDALLRQNRGWDARPPAGEPVIVLASGGLDSTVAMAWCIECFDVTVHPLFVRRGARATPYEEAAVRQVLAALEQRYPGRFGPLLILEAEIPPLSLKQALSGRAATVLGHPMRDAVLQSLAVQQAVALEARTGSAVRTVVAAAIADDPFPHTSLVALRAQTLMVCLDSDDWSWQITSPFVDPRLGSPQRKSDLIRWAVERSLPLELTRSCIGAGPEPDGSCAECGWRRDAFVEAGLADPALAKRRGR